MNIRDTVMNSKTILILACALMAAGLVVQASANQPDLEMIGEITGMRAGLIPQGTEWVFDAEYHVYLAEPEATCSRQAADPASISRARAMLSAQGLLLIPDSTNKRLMAFDPDTGDVVALDFMLLDDVATGTAIHAILGPSNNILVSDQTRNVVHNYDLNGNYLGVFAPVGGANTAIMQNIRGIALRPNGNLLVSVGGGTNANCIAEFDQAGNYLGNFVANGSGGLNSPFDVYERVGTDWLVSSSSSYQILSYELESGSYTGVFAPVTSFPQQNYEIPSGNVLVGNFSGGQVGIVELTADGALVGVYRPGTMSGFRGVYELPDGNILATSTDGVFVIDRNSNLIDTKYSGQSRFIEYVVLDASSVEEEEDGGPTSMAPGIGMVTPNPFSAAAGIHFHMPRAASATLSIHDIQGRHVKTLVTGPMDGGRHQTTWDGRDAQGQAVPQGVYLVRLMAREEYVSTRKITVMR